MLKNFKLIIYSLKILKLMTNVCLLHKLFSTIFLDIRRIKIFPRSPLRNFERKQYAI